MDDCDEGKLLFFPEATHWVQHEEADEVNQHLLEFVFTSCITKEQGLKDKPIGSYQLWIHFLIVPGKRIYSKVSAHLFLSLRQSRILQSSYGNYPYIIIRSSPIRSYFLTEHR